MTENIVISPDAECNKISMIFLMSGIEPNPTDRPVGMPARLGKLFRPSHDPMPNYPLT